VQPFGDAFIKLVRMIIAPIVLVTVVVGTLDLPKVRAILDRREGVEAAILAE
jgi:Na+/H+-dicarboxylate symporter